MRAVFYAVGGLAAALLLLPAVGGVEKPSPTPAAWVPPFQGQVTDLGKVLTPEQRHQLRQELGVSSSVHIWVLTVPSLSGEAIESFSLRVVNQWSKDQGGLGRGILVTLAVAERTARIEVGKELEETISEERAKRIINEEMLPAFRQSDYAAGLSHVVRALLEAAHPGSSFVECNVKVKVRKLESQAPITYGIAEALDLPAETAGVLGLAILRVDILDAEVTRGRKERCDTMVGETGEIIVRYTLSRRNTGFAAGEVLDLAFLGFVRFPPYRVAHATWTLRSGEELSPNLKAWVPPFQGNVTDLAKVLTPEQRHQLHQELGMSNAVHIWVLTVPSLSGEAIEAFSLRVANQWSKNQGGHGRGILVTLALAERTARIEVGKELQETIPEERANRIIEEEMLPASRQSDYAAGLSHVVRALLEAAHPGSSVVECHVKVKVRKLEGQIPLTYELAKTLDLPEETAGFLGLAILQIEILDAKVTRGRKEHCPMVGETGEIGVRYTLSRRAKEFAAGEVLDLAYLGFIGFPRYRTGRGEWTLRND